MSVSIDIKNCQGYYWESDKTEPVVFYGTKVNPVACKLERDDSANPFILEALLFDIETEESYMVKYVDGRYIVSRYNLSDSSDAVTMVEMLPNRMPEVPMLYFKQIWKKEPDALCEGFETLKPAQLVFAGFEKREG